VPFGNGTALSRLTESNRVICISVPNVTNGLNSAWQTYLTSARQIELDTGFTFFTAAPGLIESVYRAKIDGIAAASIASFSPTGGAVGDSITISGTNFTTASMILFNGASANFTIGSSNTITATVPTGATTGTISIITSGGLATSATNFVVTTLPKVNIVSSLTNTFVISWAAPSTGFVLQQNSDLTTTNWANMTNAVNSDGSLNQIVIPFSTGNNFFRLISQ
jgi:IPT/TIG domain